MLQKLNAKDIRMCVVVERKIKTKFIIRKSKKRRRRKEPKQIIKRVIVLENIVKVENKIIDFGDIEP